ncbi:unnamed protein product [Closterium sp. NIES-54]
MPSALVFTRNTHFPRENPSPLDCRSIDEHPGIAGLKCLDFCIHRFAPLLAVCVEPEKLKSRNGAVVAVLRDDFLHIVIVAFGFKWCWRCCASAASASTSACCACSSSRRIVVVVAIASCELASSCCSFVLR